ncbi:MAG: hypothetical protein RL021_2092, partial [Bacteroidota bacterium]
LPIELLRFDGYAEGSVNVLEWTTATEINNDYFTLYRSHDGTVFEPITTVQGAGNSSMNIDYRHIDRHPPSGAAAYYQLEQTDFDGTSSRSEVIRIGRGSVNGTTISLFPNPTNGSLQVEFGSDRFFTGRFLLHDMAGRLVFSRQAEARPGWNVQTLDLSMLAEGVYSVVLCDENGLSLSPPIRMVRN